MRRRMLLSLFTLSVSISSAGAQQTGTIVTVAGGGPNNMAALSANVAFPDGVAVDRAGNLFIVSAEQHRVFKVDTEGKLSVVAGHGNRLGPIGDGGPATIATLDEPRGVAVDTNGDVFIAERGRRLVRRVDGATGTISTVAGAGILSPGDGGPAVSARLNDPWAIALDAVGNLFITEVANIVSRVRRVDAQTGIITTVAGTGGSISSLGFSGDGGPASSAKLHNPFGVAVDTSGNVFIADSFNHRVRRVDATTGIINTVAGGGIIALGDGGLATSARLNQPFGVAVDSSGNLFFADRLNNRIRRVDGGTGIIATVAGTDAFGFSGDGGAATHATLATPRDVALDASGNLFIADFGPFNQRIRRVDAITGIITSVAGNGTSGFSGDHGPATDASLRLPEGLALDATGSVFIADGINQRIRRLDVVTGTITTVAGNGTAGFSGDGGAATAANLHLLPPIHIFQTNLIGVAADQAGNLFIADTGNHRVRRVDAATGTITTVAGNGDFGFSGDGGPATSASLTIPNGIALDSRGNLFIADAENHRVRRVDTATGIITTVAGSGVTDLSGDGGPAVDAGLAHPAGVVVDSSGALFLTDSGNNRVRRVDGATGIITTVAGDGSFESGDDVPATATGLAHPIGLALDAGGNLYIAERARLRIRRVAAATGIITTVAGSDGSGFSGDGGLATAARLAVPVGVAASRGVLFIADTNNHRVRRVSINYPPVADAGADLCVPCTAVGATAVLLDGSGSFDPDHDPLTYRWKGPYPEHDDVTAVARPTVTLPIGASVVELVVNDGKLDSAPDTVEVTSKVQVVGLHAPMQALAPAGQPISHPTRAFRRGQVLPLKLDLFCGTAELTEAAVAPPRIAALVREGDAIDLDTVDLTPGESGDGGLSFRYESGDWIYNLSTGGLSAGTYLITLEMPDGLRYDAVFVLR